MKISEVINMLTKIKEEGGDVDVVVNDDGMLRPVEPSCLFGQLML